MWWWRVLPVCNTVSLFGYFLSFLCFIKYFTLEVTAKLKVTGHDVQPKSWPIRSGGISSVELFFSTFGLLCWSFLALTQSCHNSVSFVQTESWAFSLAHIPLSHSLITHCLHCSPQRATEWILSCSAPHIVTQLTPHPHTRTTIQWLHTGCFHTVSCGCVEHGLLLVNCNNCIKAWFEY